MSSHPDQNSQMEQWLEIVEGDAPVLLIAPHGGRAGAAAEATLHPKVNDLETAEITRVLAARLDATALINAGMDRNEIDCNRLAQLASRAPWILDLIADRIEQIIARHGRATVLLIHGWNIIEPRVDFGLGLREAAGRLRPPNGAHVSASDRFINGQLADLAARLRAVNILPSFGMRYPGGAAQNLLQAFTPRHRSSDIAAIQRLAAIAESGAIDALQLEMSVAVRLPGALRERNIEAMSHVFSQPANGAVASTSAIPIVRETPPSTKKAAVAASGPPLRVGIEFYDPAAQAGGMASFDFGPGAAGARIMVLFDQRRVALFTAEGKSMRSADRVSLGPLILRVGARDAEFSFSGPAAVVDDGTAYLSVEHALAKSHIETAMEVSGTIEIAPAAQSFDSLLAQLEEAIAQAYRLDATPADAAKVVPPIAAFGRLRGTIVVGGRRRALDAVARIGASFTGLGPQKFSTRRMLWANFNDGGNCRALEMRALALDAHGEHRIARILRDDGWNECRIGSFGLDIDSPLAPPARVSGDVMTPSGERVVIDGEPETFMTLSRPGPDNTRIHTSLGFAVYRIGDAKGAGMFEYSRRVAAVPKGSSNDTDDD
jgi:hypothetical protein